MAGLAAALNAPGSIDALLAALAPRGADSAVSRLEGPDDAVLEVAMRATVPPTIPRVIGDPGQPNARVVGAFAVDGVASVTALDHGYAARGPAGLLDGAEGYGPGYAVILADAEIGSLVLVRSGSGPGLYYTRHGRGWLVASEPAALIGAGADDEPDPDVIARFIGTGACDDTERTFFTHVRRVLPGEAVVLRADGRIERHRDEPPPAHPVAAGALQAAVAGDRVSLLLGPGSTGAALLGTALARGDRPKPLPVHTTSFPDLDSPAAHTPAVLVPLPFGTVRHTAHTFDPRGLEFDTFLAEVGEPVPDLGLYLLWAVARGLSGDTDILVDSSLGAADCLPRLADRIASRYGVLVRCPLREAPPAAGEIGEVEIESIVDKLLPSIVGRYAEKDTAGPVRAAEIVLARSDSVAAALATPRPWSDRTASLDELRRLVAGEAADADALLRAYLVERWLRALARREMEHQPPRTDITVDGEIWTRVAVRTELIGPGDQLAEKAGWYVAKAMAEMTAEPERSQALRSPWFALLSAKPVSVAQRRFRPLWKIRPRRPARILARLAVRAAPGLAEPWVMQIAVEDGGLARVGGATLAGLVRPLWAQRWLPTEATSLSPPRPDAVAPADGAVVRAPVNPDDAAGALLEVLRYTLSPELVETLAGVAVLAVGPSGSRLDGFAAGPGVAAVPDAPGVALELCADNPAGQARGRTPVVLAFRARTPGSGTVPELPPRSPRT